MKFILYGLLLLVLWILPNRGTDVGKLLPVEVLGVSEAAGEIVVRTDTGNEGRAGTIEKAFLNLEETASGIIYLDTAEYLLLEQGAEKHLSAIGGYLKDRIKVCRAGDEVQLDKIADFLSVHEPGVKLKEALKGSRIPAISQENSRFELK